MMSCTGTCGRSQRIILLCIFTFFWHMLQTNNFIGMSWWHCPNSPPNKHTFCRCVFGVILLSEWSVQSSSKHKLTQQQLTSNTGPLNSPNKLSAAVVFWAVAHSATRSSKSSWLARASTAAVANIQHWAAKHPIPWWYWMKELQRCFHFFVMQKYSNWLHHFWLSF